MHRYLIAAVIASAAGLATALAQAPASVLDGVYTHAQAERGETVYSARCAGATRGRMPTGL